MSGPIQVLLVEDNLADADLTQETLLELRQHVNIDIVRDGQAAIDYVFQRGIYHDAPRPDLILLDLNLPKVGGHDVLTELKASRDHHCIPVVVLSSSDAPLDITSSYERGAASYVTKPVGYVAFQEVVRALDHFWFSAVSFPH